MRIGENMDFTKTKPKVNMTVRVDPDMLTALKKKKLNVSKIVRVAIEQAVNEQSEETNSKSKRRGA